METISTQRCFKGTLGYYKHAAQSTKCDMRFTVYVPDSAKVSPAPALYYLAGLTCTEENFTTKAGAYKLASELGLILIAPDTSPRGDDVADDDAYDLGKGASFYLNATQSPWSTHYQMETYLTEELFDLILKEFPADPKRIGIFGHSMGGHGALTLYLRHPEKYRSVSAFAPICAPTECPWGEKAFSHYLGSDRASWNDHDATQLILKSGNASNPTILIDQGLSDTFLPTQLHPDHFAAACEKVGQKLMLRKHEGYDHSYFFIQTFMDDHLRHHAHIVEKGAIT